MDIDGLTPNAASPLADGFEWVDRSIWHMFLHSLRSRELSRLPTPGSVVLSPGCSGTWYFDWFDEFYPGRIERHVGVEAFSPKPDDLPASVDWIAESIGEGTSVADESVDMVFAGQAIEHFWAHEVVTFLAESWRVLRPGGVIALDSPNRRVTQGLGWIQGEHTFELTVDEALRFLRLAGFVDPIVRGLWLCYDRDQHSFLPLDPDFSNEDWKRRIELGETRPEDSFVWWIEAVRGTEPPVRPALDHAVHEVSTAVVPQARNRWILNEGWREDAADEVHQHAPDYHPATLRGGPMIPLAAGEYTVAFDLRRDHREEFGAPDADLLRLDVIAEHSGETLSTRTVRRSELAPGEWTRVELPSVTLSEMKFVVQFVATTVATGRMTLAAVVDCRVRRPAVLAAPDSPVTIELDQLRSALDATRARRAVHLADRSGAAITSLRSRLRR